MHDIIDLEAQYERTTLSGAQVGFPGGFSVLMAVYYNDDPRLFEMAVDSVFSNTLQPTHFLLVADGPLSAGLEKILKELQQRYNNRVELLRLPVNVGLANALNLGLAHIKQLWIVRADADDYNLPYRFAALAGLLAAQPQLELMSSAILEVDSTDKPISIRAVPVTEKEIRRFVKLRSPFNHAAVAYRRDAVLACGGYPNIYLKEDYALWCHMLARNKRVANTAEVLVKVNAGYDMYRRRGGLRYAKAEWDLQKVMISCGLKSRPRAFLDGLFRAAGFLVPTGLRGKVYEVFLRKTTVL